MKGGVVIGGQSGVGGLELTELGPGSPRHCRPKGGAPTGAAAEPLR